MKMYTTSVFRPLLFGVVAALLLSGAVYAEHDGHHSSMFQGPKANRGTVTHSTDASGRSILTLSPDFVVPNTPAPHWQIVDSNGNAYLLQRLKIKDDKINRSIVVPAYIANVAKVQIWCAWAETLLGEASFASPVQ
ncbi:MAG: hypothetical protein KIT09_20120 [Bryobacteraceae bacterium]|nr:hypothetical protein [Bryobacteraceae bacterium]